ncbi:MAG: hypothetical protein GQ574_06785 [Crocinitomix sp.]|nr:hypothetical protein [Crocinitomix sp.]
MKTIKTNLFFALLLLLTGNCFASSIGVGPIKTFGIFAETETASTIARLELVKLGKYQVLDRFDMRELEDYDTFQSCFGKTCLIEYGKKLNVDYILSGNIDGLGNKIVVTLKLIDIKSETIIKSHSSEFNNQEVELQRMIGIVIQEMHDIDVDPLLKKQLMFNNENITSNNVGRVSNRGPRMGLAYMTGTLNELAVRPESQGGLEISPLVSNLGYQFEAVYVGTDKFSALFEGLINFTGLEQGKFLPSFAILNGFRFGKQGWEFAFGPSFGLTKTSVGFFAKGGDQFGDEGTYWTEDEYNASAFGENDLWTEYEYDFTRNLDTRGRLDINTRWIWAVGRTFQSGALNVPVNIFYSSQKNGGMAGVSVGFNITRSKKSIN